MTHLALDGSRLDVEGELDLSRPFTSVLDVGLRGHRYEFTAGAVGLGGEVAAALGLDGFDEELNHAGGALRVAHGTVTDPRTGLGDRVTVACWTGVAHELVTSLYGVTTAEVLDVFTTVDIVEGPDGIGITPAVGSGATVLGGALVLKEVPGLGLLEIAGRTKDAVRELPDWPGLPLGRGELFRDTLSNGRPYFVLAQPAAVVTVLPLDGTAVDRVPGLLGSLSVSMRATAQW